MLNKFLDDKGKRTILVVLIVSVLGWAGLNVSENDVNKYVTVAIPNTVSKNVAAKIPQQKETPAQIVKSEFNELSHISPQRRTHILFGDATGGGHLYGTGKPCKSEFPKHWYEQTIIKEVELIAANDNLNWERQNNGYYVTEQNIGSLNVRVVKGRDAEQVITAYPTNVPRNSCPSNDNKY